MVHLEIHIGIEGDVLLQAQQHGDKGVPHCSMLALPRNPGYYLLPDAMHSVVPDTEAVGLGPIAVLAAHTRYQSRLSAQDRERVNALHASVTTRDLSRLWTAQ